MKRTLFNIAKVICIILVLSAPGPQTGGWGLGGNPRPGQNYAFFQAFPSSGKGVPDACSSTAPTGVRGQVLSFTRATTAMCTKAQTGGLATTGIANGDLVSVASGVARVEYDANGVKGLLVEAARTNSLVRSQEIDNASWTKGASVGTITADYATAPDGTMTADRYQYSNTTNDYILQTFSVGSLAATGSVYLKGTSGSGTINLCRGGATSQCVTCPYVSTSWSRCVYAGTLAASNNLFIGCDTPTLGAACAQTGLDVLVWGFQGETGAYVTSYIPTTSASETRNAETGSFALPVAMNAASGSHAGNFTVPAIAPVVVNIIRYQATAQPLYVYPSSQFVRTYDGTTEVTNSTPAWTPLVSYRVSSTYSGSTQTATDWVPDTASGAFDGQMGATPLTSLTVCGLDGSQASFLCSRICADPDPTRCR